MKRSALFLVLTCSLLLPAPGAEAEEVKEFLLCVEMKNIALDDLVLEVAVLKDLDTHAIARGGYQGLNDLDRLGVAEKEYFLAYGKDAEMLPDLGPGDTLHVGKAWALVRTSQETALWIAGLGFEIAKLFMDPIRLVPEFSAFSEEIITIHPEIQDMVDQVSKSNLEATVDDLVDAGGYGTRKSNTEGGHWAAQYIHDEFVSYGIADVSFHDFNVNADNVVAVIPGAVFPENIFVLGGHFDSIVTLSATAPGADDNASGTAAVMEAARIMSGHQFENTVVFIAFASEEFGLIGSNAYAKEASQRGDNIIGMLNVDMIGYLDPGDAADVDIYAGSGSSGLRDLALWATENYVSGFPAIVGAGSSGSSDYASFTSYGYSAIWFKEDFPQDSPYIHTTNDIVGVSVNNFELATNCTKSILATLASLAEPVDEIAIGHTPLDDTDDTENPYTVMVKVVSIEPLASGYPVVRYAINGGGFTDLLMTPTGNPNEYEAGIPAQPLNTSVSYYMEAEDDLGSSDTSPAAAPDKTYVFDVEAQGGGWLVAEMDASLIKGSASHSNVMNYAVVLIMPVVVVLFWRRKFFHVRHRRV